AVKVVKSMLAAQPEHQRLSGYHIEALAVAAATRYEGPRTIKALTTHILTESSRRVLEPMVDVTGQSRHVDDYLGGRGSLERQIVSMRLEGLARKLDAARSV